MNKSYLVTGAKLRCMWGSKPGTLVISEGHNVIASGRPKANCSDSRKGENIPDFGICGISSCGRTCRECMSLADKWINTSGSSWKLEKLESDDKFRNIRTLYKDGEERYAYNDNDQRTLYVDKNGNKTQYSYDEQGNLIKIQDALNRVIQVTDSEGNQVSYQYDERDHLLSEIKIKRDSCGNPVSITDHNGRTVRYEWGSMG